MEGEASQGLSSYVDEVPQETVTFGHLCLDHVLVSPHPTPSHCHVFFLWEDSGDAGWGLDSKYQGQCLNHCCFINFTTLELVIACFTALYVYACVCKISRVSDYLWDFFFQLTNGVHFCTGDLCLSLREPRALLTHSCCEALGYTNQGDHVPETQVAPAWHQEFSGESCPFLPCHSKPQWKAVCSLGRPCPYAWVLENDVSVFVLNSSKSSILESVEITKPGKISCPQA